MEILTPQMINPDFLSGVNRKRNIVICVPETEPNTIVESETFPDSFQINLPNDCNLSAANVVRVSSSTLSTSVRPSFKISMPIGIKLRFDNFVDNHNQDVFLKIYESFDVVGVCDDKDHLHHNIIKNAIFVLYIDTTRIRETSTGMVLKKETPFVNFNFNWYIQTKQNMENIDNIYLIVNSQVYEDFEMIF